jgi:putative membrane protein insertion efficiency factor
MSVTGRAVVALIRLYQTVVSPVLGPRCRFHPSCSCYAADAVTHHGAARGLWLALRRIARCHPWTEGGIDPVPAPATPTPSSQSGMTTSR